MASLVRCVLALIVIGGCTEGPGGPSGNPGTPGEDGQDGRDGDQGPPGDTPDAGVDPVDITPPVLGPDDQRPGLVLSIQTIAGGTGTNGNAKPGDQLAVTFTIEDNAGKRIPIEALSRAGILVSGPTTNYQRVIPIISDVKTAAVANADGSYTYTFATGLPTSYAAPYNDTNAFGADDGELTGQPLASGTYSVGMEAARPVFADGAMISDAGNAVANFLVGTATTLDTRDVITAAACNRCHERVQAHGGLRNDVRYCLTCHTAGSEDRNMLLVENGTPGVTVDFGVMIHRVHSAAHLPSVLGVGTKADGTRDYAKTPAPYVMVGYNNAVFDFSHAASPLMPGAYVAYTMDATNTMYLGTGGNGPMPRDVGYATLTGEQKRVEDEMRSGLMACATCHGDPDGAGPLAAPTQGALHTTTVTRKACGSCHDDIDWTKPYTSNGMTMPAQLDDTACRSCHASSGTSLAVTEAHLHPYDNPSFNTGVNVAITGVGGGTGPDGRHRAGDPFEIAFSVTDDAGIDLHINRLTRFQLMVSGPTTNPQLVVPNINLFDFAFRKSSPFTGTGTISTPTFSGSGSRQVIAVVFTSATTFDVVGSVDAPLTARAIGAASGATATVSYGGLTFTLAQGATSFAANDRFYIEAIPIASSYAIKIPIDVTTEYLGRATGDAEVRSVANAPLYWGRHTVFERTAIQIGTTSTAAVNRLAPYIEVDASLVPGIAMGDRIVIDDGLATEEYAQVNLVQTIDDKNGADLGTRDRLWVTPALRFAHAAGASVQEVTLTAKREGSAYTISNAAAGELAVGAGAFAAGNPIVVTYRTDGRFGFRRGPGDELQAVYPPAGADSDDIGVSEGDWKGLPLVDGTYKVGGWANRDFTVHPLGVLSSTVKAWNDIATDLTTYRMISPPATRMFQFGAATTEVARDIIANDACDSCHGDLQAHGFGRRGYETCTMCHTISGFEDGPKARFASWYTGFTPNVSMEFRGLLHKVHMGKELMQGSSYEVIGVFLGVPYPLKYDKIGFPNMPGGAMQCTSCHLDNLAWQLPAARNHPAALSTPTKAWGAACGSCHDAPAAQAHIATQTTPFGVETCTSCHSPGQQAAVKRAHLVR
jgi:hypothetical protein